MPSSSLKDLVGDGSVGGLSKAYYTLTKLFIFIYYWFYIFGFCIASDADMRLITSGDYLRVKTVGD